MKYLLVRDGKVEHLLGLADGGSRSIASSASRLDLYRALLGDAGLDVVEFDVALGLVPSPVLEAAAKAVPARKAGAGSTEGGVCSWCHQQRIKDGVTSTGAQRWRCPVPHNVKTNNPSPRTRRRAGAPRRGTTKALFAKNPACPGGHGPMNIRGRAKGVTYYICKKGCPTPPTGQGWSSINLPGDGGKSIEAMVRKRVEACNGHDPQVRDDIVQEILLDIESKKITFHELDNDAIRRYIRSQQRLGQDKFRDQSLDAPARDNETPLVEKLAG